MSSRCTVLVRTLLGIVSAVRIPDHDVVPRRIFDESIPTSAKGLELHKKQSIHLSGTTTRFVLEALFPNVVDSR